MVILIIFSALLWANPVRAEVFQPIWKDIIDSAKKRLEETRDVIVYNNPNSQNEETKAGSSHKNKNENENKDHKKSKDDKGYPNEKASVKEMISHAEFASETTGVNKNFLIGMLVVESALGQNTGECTYKEVEEGAIRSYQNGNLSYRAWLTFQRRKNTIESLAGKLGYDPEKLKVSCNPSNYAGTGGAMGVAQFMPDTWLEYEGRIARIVGKETPDPWDVRDGVVAMALKLSDVPGVRSHNVWAERNASKMYLSGTTSWRYDWYANEAQYWKINYKKLVS